MELNITQFVNTQHPSDYSASVAELGWNAGQLTWNAAKECEVTLLHTDDEIQETKDFFESFGAWDAEEMSARTNNEVNALLIQFISGDMRDNENDRIFTTDTGESYYYINA